MLKTLVKDCEDAGYSVRYLRRFPFMCANRSDKYELLIQNENAAFAVKLWSAVKVHNTLVVKKNGTVREGMLLCDPINPERSRKRLVGGTEKTVPVTRRNFRVKKDKIVHTVLLYYPRNERAFVEADGRRIDLCDGQRLFGKILCSPESLVEMLIAKKKGNYGSI